MKTTFPVPIRVLAAVGLGVLLAGPAGVVAAEAEPAPEPFTVVATGDRVNIRGQATIHSEVLGQVNKGDKLTVLDTITLKKPKEGDTTNWFKVTLPNTVPVWVSAAFVDTNQMVVASRRLNLRGGPGENFSVLGTLTRGTALKEVRRKDEWLQIETPAGAYGFVAAEYFTKPAPAAVVATPPPPPPPPPTVVTPPPPPPPTPTVVETNPPVAVAPPPTVVTPPAPIPPLIKEEADAKERNLARINGYKTPPVKEPAPATVVIEAAPKRIVTHEGVVRFTVHVNSPSWYELEAPDTKKIINYLYTTDTNIVFENFRNKRVTVTGEEAMDRRWKNTPVLTVKEIKVVE